jgi:hypothetical protein
MGRLALALHRQNPSVLSVERARQYLEQWIPEVVKKGLVSETGIGGMSTAGFNVNFERDEDGYGEVQITLNLATLWVEPNGKVTPDLEPFEWSALKVLSGVDTDSTD